MEMGEKTKKAGFAVKEEDEEEKKKAKARKKKFKRS